MTLAFIAVLMCMAGLFGVESRFPYKGCTFPQVSKDPGEIGQESVIAAMNRLEPLRKLNKVFTVANGKESYDFAICSSVIPKVDNTTGVIQHGTAKTNDPVLGRIDYADISGGKNWLMLEYSNGTNYTTHCQGGYSRRALIMITCAWGEKEGVFRFVEENNGKIKGCYYLFELEHEAACSPLPKKLSVGSILLIVFFSIAGVYLLVGVIYQRITSGAKGIDQIPNLGFWLNFGSLTADGCDLVCRCKADPGSNLYRSVDIGGTTPDTMGSGMGSGQEADEHLLPM